MKSETFVILVILNLFIIANISAQQGAYWQGISVKNPAVIGTPSDWVFGSYLFTNMNKLTPGDDKGPTAFAIGVDYRIAPQIGSFGLIYTKEKISAEVVSLLEMIYAHSVPFKNGFINAGLSGGINKYEFDLSNYQNPYAEFDPLFVDGTKFQHLKMGVGLFYNSSKLDLGISAIRFFELDKNEESNPYNYNIDYTSNFVTLLGAYRFNCVGKLMIEPNLMVDFSKGNTDALLGVYFQYNEMVWAGYNNFDFNDLHSILMGADILKRFRVGYSYSFTKIFSSKNVNLHEFLLGIRIDGI